jgi:HK97 family phage portal protein
VVLPASEIIHDRMWCLFHPLVGLSPLFATSLAAIQGLEIQGQSARFFRNSAVPSGILVTPQKLDDELAQKFKLRFETNYGGANRGRVAVLGNGLEYKQITMSAVDAEVIGQLKLSGEMICSTLHVPAFKVGLGPIPTYQNVQALNGIYYSDCLQSLITDVQQSLRFGLDLPQKGYTLHLNLEDLLLMDTQTQIEVAARGVEKAIFAPDEARRKFNLPPVPGGQYPMLQQQNFSLEALAKRDAKADPFAADKPAPVAAPAAPPAADTAKAEVVAITRALELRRRPTPDFLKVANGNE